jgi:DNA-binding Lrp family transcriptional regulator
MVKAFLTLNTLPDKMEKVLNDIKEIKGVEQAHTVYGIYDIIAEVRGKDVNELKGLILKVRKMPDVLHTLIQIVVK